VADSFLSSFLSFFLSDLKLSKDECKCKSGFLNVKKYLASFNEALDEDDSEAIANVEDSFVFDIPKYRR
jgi:hypothetical protein